MGHTLFVSDVHVHPDRPASQKQFIDFLNKPFDGVDALYILGDLFDYWLDDEQLDGLSFDWLPAFKRWSDAGIPVFFMPGNHDFLIGKRFLDATGMRPLRDPTVVTCYGKRLLLAHGDAFCTQDKGYQRMRLVLHHPVLRFLAKHLPLFVKRCVLHGIQNGSKQAKRAKKPALMDVDLRTVEAAVAQAGVSVLIHGHTHEPKHEKQDKGYAFERFVLGAWDRSMPALRLEDDGRFFFVTN